MNNIDTFSYGCLLRMLNEDYRHVLKMETQFRFLHVYRFLG